MLKVLRQSISVAFVGMIAVFAANPCYATVQANCSTAQVGVAVTNTLSTKWREGSVRVWEQQGEFWSMPISTNISKLSEGLRKQLSKDCDVQIFDNGSFTARILPKNQDTIAPPTPHPSQDIAPSFVSPIGTTLGIFEPTKGEMILIMYPAKIASAIARGKGTSPRKDLKEVLSAFPAELDIEYNFGEFVIQIFGGTGKSSMREAADKAFGDLRRLGYQPGPGSDKSIAAFDGIFPPDHHESFWLHKNGALRVELEKIKHGQVRINIHETKQRQ